MGTAIHKLIKYRPKVCFLKVPLIGNVRFARPSLQVSRMVFAVFRYLGFTSLPDRRDTLYVHCSYSVDTRYMVTYSENSKQNYYPPTKRHNVGRGYLNTHIHSCICSISLCLILDPS